MNFFIKLNNYNILNIGLFMKKQKYLNENLGGELITKVYLVRHADPNYNNHNDELRELSEKGLEDRKLVIEFL